MKTNLLSLLLGATLVSTLVTPTQAATFNLTANIDGAQANAGAGTGSPGTGFASMTFDTITNLFSWNISWANLTAPVTVAHFHGPATPHQNAGVVVDFGAISGLTSPSIGSTIITDVQENDLLSNLWYINIHTTANPGGEIRGQVTVVPVPEPSTIGFLALTTLGAATLKRKKKAA